jgi:Icc-related predicted phosphoesterase
MRLWIFSDLHIDVCHSDAHFAFHLPEERPEHDAVVIAGDIREHMVKSVRWIANNGFTKPVIFVAGNHEFYRTERDRELEKALEEAARYPNIHVLQDSHVDVGGVRFIGSTLWTDYRLDGEGWREMAMHAASDMMNDHRLIRLASAGYRRWLPKDCAAEHERSVAYIKAMLDLPTELAKVVITHHAPSKRSIGLEHIGSTLNPAFASNLDHLVHRAALWVHGHVHNRSDYTIGDGRVLCNPRGYATNGEWSGFDPSLVVEI